MARRSRCDRAKIGCVIVDRRQRVLATSYNGPPAGWYVSSSGFTKGRLPEGCGDFCTRGREGPTRDTVDSYTDCPANHAEINGLMMTDRTDREDGAIYVTGHVCFTCAKAIGNSGLCRVYLVDADDAREAYRQPDRSIYLLERSGLRVERVS